MINSHGADFPAVLVTLPWENPVRGELVTVPLVPTIPLGSAIDAGTFNKYLDGPETARRDEWGP